MWRKEGGKERGKEGRRQGGQEGRRERGGKEERKEEREGGGKEGRFILTYTSRDCRPSWPRHHDDRAGEAGLTMFTVRGRQRRMLVPPVCSVWDSSWQNGRAYLQVTLLSSLNLV